MALLFKETYILDTTQKNTVDQTVKRLLSGKSAIGTSTKTTLLSKGKPLTLAQRDALAQRLGTTKL